MELKEKIRQLKEIVTNKGNCPSCVGESCEGCVIRQYIDEDDMCSCDEDLVQESKAYLFDLGLSIKNMEE